MNTRQQGEHVPYEGTDWFQVYGLTLELQPLVASLVTGLRAGQQAVAWEVNSEKMPEFPHRYRVVRMSLIVCLCALVCVSALYG